MHVEVSSILREGNVALNRSLGDEGLKDVRHYQYGCVSMTTAVATVVIAHVRDVTTDHIEQSVISACPLTPVSTPL